MGRQKGSQAAALQAIQISKQVELLTDYKRKDGSVVKKGTIYNSVKEAAKDLKVTGSAVTQLCNKGIRMVCTSNAERAGLISYRYKGQTFNTKSEIAEQLQITYWMVSQWISFKVIETIRQSPKELLNGSTT